MTTVQGQKVKGQGHKVTHNKLTQSRALALVTLESKRPLIVGDSKNVIVFDSLLTGHVIRRMRDGRVRIFNGNQWKTLSLITQERIGVGASNFVGIIAVGVDACGILSRSAGQTIRK